MIDGLSTILDHFTNEKKGVYGSTNRVAVTHTWGGVGMESLFKRIGSVTEKENFLGLIK